MSHKAKPAKTAHKHPLTQVLPQPEQSAVESVEIPVVELYAQDSPANSDNGMISDIAPQNLQIFLTSGIVSLIDSVDPSTDSHLSHANPFVSKHVCTRSIHDSTVHVSLAFPEATKWLNLIIEEAEETSSECAKLFKKEKADKAQFLSEQLFDNIEMIDAVFNSKWSDIRADHEDLIVAAKSALDKALASMYAIIARYRDHLARSAPVIPVTSNSTK